MNRKTMDKVQIGLVGFATLVLLVMNAFTFDAVTLGGLRTILAISWICVGVLQLVTRKMEKRHDGR